MQRWWQETAVIVVAQNAVKGSLNLVCETEVVNQENFERGWCSLWPRMRIGGSV